MNNVKSSPTIQHTKQDKLSIPVKLLPNSLVEQQHALLLGAPPLPLGVQQAREPGQLALKLGTDQPSFPHLLDQRAVVLQLALYLPELGLVGQAVYAADLPVLQQHLGRRVDHLQLVVGGRGRVVGRALEGLRQDFALLQQRLDQLLVLVDYGQQLPPGHFFINGHYKCSFSQLN
jgi:hypothetical protein